MCLAKLIKIPPYPPKLKKHAYVRQSNRETERLLIGFALARAPAGTKREPKGSQGSNMEPKVNQGEPNVSQREPKVRHR